jgi:hypothetical protein
MQLILYSIDYITQLPSESVNGLPLRVTEFVHAFTRLPTQRPRSA